MAPSILTGNDEHYCLIVKEGKKVNVAFKQSLLRIFMIPPSGVMSGDLMNIVLLSSHAAFRPPTTCAVFGGFCTTVLKDLVEAKP